MLKDKGILILITGEIKSTMHYTTKNGLVYIITTKTLKNIPEINKNNTVELQIGKEIYSATANLIYDVAKVKEVFDQMLVEKNTYFTTLTDDLIAIEFNLK